MNTLEAGTAVVHEEVASTDGEVSGTITKRSQVSASLHVGPLPSPTVLGGYNRVEAGLAGRIVKMAEDEQAHRHALERTGQQEAFTLLKRGQMIGALLLLALLSAGTALAMTGHMVTGFVTIGTAIVGAVVSTYKNQRARNENDDDGTAEDRLPDGADNGSRRKNLPPGGTKARPPKKDQRNKRSKRRSGEGKSKRGA